MTKNTTLAAAAVLVIALVAASVSVDALTWPPRCAGYKKAFRECFMYINGNVTEIPDDCCPTIQAYLAPAKNDGVKRKAACYCLSDTINSGRYDKDRCKDVFKKCDFPTPPSFFDCRNA